MTWLLELLLLLGLGVFWLELRHRLRPASPLSLKALDFKVKQTNSDLDVEIWLEISNPHPRMEPINRQRSKGGIAEEDGRMA